MSTELETKNENQLQSFDLMGALPNLQEAKVIPADLTSEYWTPTTQGEFKLCFFQEIKSSTYTDEQTGETIELPCAVLLEQTPDGILKSIRNGSKRLVASLEDAIHGGKIKQGTPLKLEFMGKQKNATNAFQSDRWSIKPLFVG